MAMASSSKAGLKSDPTKGSGEDESEAGRTTAETIEEVTELIADEQLGLSPLLQRQIPTSSIDRIPPVSMHSSPNLQPMFNQVGQPHTQPTSPRLSPQSPLFPALSGSSSSRLDWTKTLTPTERSCITLVNIEPCVNKAVDNLESLLEVLLEKLDHDLEAVPEQARPRRMSFAASSKGSDKRDSVLSIEGIPTGTTVERLRKHTLEKNSSGFKGSVVISSVLNLVAKLEHDRQEARKFLAEQEETTRRLAEEKEKRDEERLSLIMELVQAEHEKYAEKLRSLQWYMFFQERRLNTLLGAQHILTKRNTALKDEVKYLREINPLVTDKVGVLEGKIRDTNRMQKETEADCEALKKDMEEVEEKRQHSHIIADSEKQKTKELLEEGNRKLNTARDELKELQEQRQDLSSNLSHSTSQLSSLSNLLDSLKSDLNATSKKYQVVKKRVDNLDTQRLSMLAKRQEHRKIKEALEARNKEELEKLKEEHALLTRAMDKDQAIMMKAKRDSEDQEQEIELCKETIIKTKLQIVDYEKSIDRAYREIDRLASQLEVSLLDFNHASRNHRRIQEEFKLEKIRCDKAVGELQERVAEIKTKIKEERKVQFLYESKTRAQQEVLSQLKAEHSKQEERVQGTEGDLDKQVCQKEEKMKALEGIHKDTLNQLHQTETELSALKKAVEDLEAGLGVQRTELTQEESGLKDQLGVRVNEVEVTSERVKQLESDIEDKEKGIAMVAKLQKTTTAAIEKLAGEVDDWEEKLAAESEEERSWKVEHKEITDFAADATSKHDEYLTKRKELLKDLEVRLSACLKKNSVVACRYHNLQCEFIAVKTEALKVVEKKLKLETSLRDHKQLLRFQSSMYSFLEEHYQSRGMLCRRQLAHYQQQSISNMEHLKLLREDLKTVLSLLMMFLDSEQMKVLVEKDRDLAWTVAQGSDQEQMEAMAEKDRDVPRTVAQGSDQDQGQQIEKNGDVPRTVAQGSDQDQSQQMKAMAEKDRDLAWTVDQGSNQDQGQETDGDLESQGSDQDRESDPIQDTRRSWTSQSTPTQP